MGKIELAIQNKYLNKMIELVSDIPNLQPKQGRAVRKFVEKLTSKYQEYLDSRQELINQYGDLDENGQVKSDEHDQIIFKDSKEVTTSENKQLFINASNELLNEDVTLIGGEYASQFEVVSELILNLEQTGMTLDYEQSVIYDIMCEIFEAAQN